MKIGLHLSLALVLSGIAVLNSSYASANSVLVRDTSKAFSVKQLIELAHRDNKALQAARLVVDIGQARLLQAGLRSNPILAISKRSDFAFANEGEYSNAIMLSQSFPISGRLARQKDVARVDIALAEAEVAEAERQLAADIAADAYHLWVLDEQIRTRKSLIEIQLALTKITRERFKAAEVSELDVNTAQLDLQKLSQDLILLQSQREALCISINTRMAREANADLRVDEALPTLSGVMDLPQLQNMALQLRPDLHAALLNVDRAQAEKMLANAMRWEDWTVGLEFSQDKQVIIGAPPQGSNRAIGISASIPLPFYNKAQGLLAEANATHNEALAQVDALRVGISSEVLRAYTEASHLQTVLTKYDKTLLPVSERNVRLAQQGYRQGLVPIFDVVQAQRQQADLSSAYLATLDQFLQAFVHLHTAVGDYTSVTNFDK